MQRTSFGGKRDIYEPKVKTKKKKNHLLLINNMPSVLRKLPPGTIHYSGYVLMPTINFLYSLLTPNPIQFILTTQVLHFYTNLSCKKLTLCLSNNNNKKIQDEETFYNIEDVNSIRVWIKFKIWIGNKNT